MNTISAFPPETTALRHKANPSLSRRVTLDGTTTVLPFSESRSKHRLADWPLITVSLLARSQRSVCACKQTAKSAKTATLLEKSGNENISLRPSCRQNTKTPPAPNFAERRFLQEPSLLGIPRRTDCASELLRNNKAICLFLLRKTVNWCVLGHHFPRPSPYLYCPRAFRFFLPPIYRDRGSVAFITGPVTFRLSKI